MDRRCAWCGAALGSGGVRSNGAPVSHGICPECADYLTGGLGIPLESFLESLGAPVFLVDVSTGARILMASRDGLDLAGKEALGVQGQLLGDVFECNNATLPGGCGRTVHCSGCVIRNSVEHTWSTGEALERVPATLKPRGRGPESSVTFEISTERVGGEVLLRIDGAPPSLRPLDQPAG